jgi:uncharacterized RDD family membrane protein YckC
MYERMLIMKNKVKNQEDYEVNYIMRRAGSLLVDYLTWYLIYAVMILYFFVKNNGSPTVSGNLMYYKDTFDIIIKTPVFSLTYLGIICILEIVIPLLTSGQSLTKKIFKIRVTTENYSKIRLIFRSIIKIIVLNPYGVIAYLIGNSINGNSINIVSNVLSVIFIISVILAFKDKRSLHDRITNTCIKLA